MEWNYTTLLYALFRDQEVDGIDCYYFCRSYDIIPCGNHWNITGLIFPKSPHRREGLAPRCRLFAT
uniref:Uncharacterized protein n=1 Tax=Oryza sativa subsp. japonica TaxID=39947 RepID=Q2QMV1_ORYSJ|nr:hypothetical protein LOC_Os12g39930 [Oryza sativa Japonica Group]